MNNDRRDILRKPRVLEHAAKIGDVSKTCRYFGIGRAAFYRWRKAYSKHGEAGLINCRSVPHNHPRKTSPEITEKILGGPILYIQTLPVLRSKGIGLT